MFLKHTCALPPNLLMEAFHVCVARQCFSVAPSVGSPSYPSIAARPAASSPLINSALPWLSHVLLSARVRTPSPLQPPKPATQTSARPKPAGLAPSAIPTTLLIATYPDQHPRRPCSKVCKVGCPSRHSLFNPRALPPRFAYARPRWLRSPLPPPPFRPLPRVPSPGRARSCALILSPATPCPAPCWPAPATSSCRPRTAPRRW
jgi:hypothetical protein